MRKIWVYDDSEVVESYARELQEIKILKEEFQIDPMSKKEFRDQIKTLTERERMFRSGQDWDYSSDLDKTSIFIVDFDLFDSFEEYPGLTSESVAYLARCFSKCGFILGMNHPKDGPKAFDLTLKRHPDSYCDLNIGNKHLNNPGLWGAETSGFRPWCWPEIPNYSSLFQKRIEDVEKHIDDPILQTLDLGEIVRFLPMSASRFLGGDPDNVTFRQFVFESGQGLNPRDRPPKDEHPDIRLLARIAAARISKWLECLVLPGQDILIDAPHLVSWFPSLILENISDIAVWNQTTKFGEISDLGLDHDKIEECRFKKSYWLSRHVWLREKISNSDKIKEVSEPWARQEVGFAFCEDASKFYKNEECREFVAEVDSPFKRRFIRYFPEKADYKPKVSLF